jgi:glycerol-3-phosphate dehydrogenase
MDIGIIGGGINGLCCAWQLAQRGHKVCLYERKTFMRATSSASSKLLHGGLRYLENYEFRLVREALRERDGWLKRVPHLTKPLRLVMPVYKNSRRPKWMIAAGLFLYDHLAGHSILPKAKKLSVNDLKHRDPMLKIDGLLGGYEFSDGQMDDYCLGLWVATQAQNAGAVLIENTEITVVTKDGQITTKVGERHEHERLINAAGPWAVSLLQQSNLESPFQLDLVRGSHLILEHPSRQAYLFEVPSERRIFFVLPWQGKTLLGTTEIRQTINDPIECSQKERVDLLKSYGCYFPSYPPNVVGSFSGIRPLIYSSTDSSKATREYAIHRTGNLFSVFGGKWTTALSLANKVAEAIR